MPYSVFNAALDKHERIYDNDLLTAEALPCKYTSTIVPRQVWLFDHGSRKARQGLAVLSLCLHDSSIFLCIHNCLPHAGQFLLNLNSRLQVEYDHGILGLFQPIQTPRIEQA